MKAAPILLVACMTLVAPLAEAKSTSFSFQAPADVRGIVLIEGPGNHGLVGNTLFQGMVYGKSVLVEQSTVTGLEADDVVYWKTGLAETPWKTVDERENQTALELKSTGKWGVRSLRGTAWLESSGATILDPVAYGEGFSSWSATPPGFPEWREPLVANHDGPALLSDDVKKNFSLRQFPS